MAGKARTKITKRVVDALPSDGSIPFTWDSELRGFGVRVTPNGTKSFILQYRPYPGGRSTPARRFTIGAYSEALTAERARAKAIQLIAGIKDGKDPAEILRADREAPTVAQLCDEYLDDGCNHKRASTLATDRGRVLRHIKPLLGAKRVKDLQRADIQRFHNDVAAGKTKVDVKTGNRGRAIVEGGVGTAARTTGLLGGILTFAVEKGYIAENPAKGVKRATDRKCERFLTDAEFAALGTALCEAEAEWMVYGAAHDAWREAGRVDKAPSMPGNAASPTATAAVRLLMLTGCRKSEILTLKWSYVDLERGILNLPTRKTEQDARVRLGAPARELLAHLQEHRIEGNEYVLPGEKRGHHLVGLPRAWTRICKRAGVSGVRLHDLRHSFASAAAARATACL